MAYATVMKLRKALAKRAGRIYAGRNLCAPGERPVEGKDLTSEQLKWVTTTAFEEFGNMDQTSVQQEMPVETTRACAVRKTHVSA